MSQRFLSGTFLLIFILFVFSRQSAFADCRFFSSQIDTGSYGVADYTGRILSSCNGDTPFVPASIIKIPLALAALDILGAQFRFSTEFFVDVNNNLYIRGQGDPFLISEEVALMVERLQEKGLREVNNIIIDNSFYTLEQQSPGRGQSNNPYDVPVSALSVNFNTVFLRVHDNGTVVSAEPQTPTLPIMTELGRMLPPGKHRVNICQNNCLPDQQSSRYAFELFRAIFDRHKIAVRGGLKLQNVPGTLESFLEHHNSKTLEDIIVAFLKYSNNFVANQVFLQCGKNKYGPPITWLKAEKAVSASLEKYLGQEYAGQIVMKDGAGLSRENRVTAVAMLKVLEKFKGNAYLLQENKDAILKSGTLDGVYNYAGYLSDRKPFVIMLNQEKNTRDAILKLLNSGFEPRKVNERP